MKDLNVMIDAIKNLVFLVIAIAVLFQCSGS